MFFCLLEMIFILCVYFACMCVCVPHRFLMPIEVEVELGCWELNASPLEEQAARVLQPSCVFLDHSLPCSLSQGLTDFEIICWLG